MKLTKHTYILFLFTYLLFLSGCKSKKLIETNGQLESKSQKELLDDVLQTQLKYQTISAKGNVEFKMGNSSQKFPAVFKMIHDSIMQASIRMPIIGSEVIRVNITPTGIVIFDRLNKNYVSESFSDSKALSNLDFNFYNLQALFTNQLFVPGQKTVTNKSVGDFKFTSTPEVHMLQTKDKDGLLYSFAVDASNHIASTIIYSEQKDITLQWSYDEFVNDGGNIYPTNMTANVQVAKKRVDLGITYSKLDVNQKMEVDTAIPSKYKQVTFEELIGSYIKLK